MHARRGADALSLAAVHKHAPRAPVHSQTRPRTARTHTTQYQQHVYANGT